MNKTVSVGRKYEFLLQEGLIPDEGLELLNLSISDVTPEVLSLRYRNGTYELRQQYTHDNQPIDEIVGRGVDVDSLMDLMHSRKLDSIFAIDSLDRLDSLMTFRANEVIYKNEELRESFDIFIEQKAIEDELNIDEDSASSRIKALGHKPFIISDYARFMKGYEVPSDSGKQVAVEMEAVQ